MIAGAVTPEFVTAIRALLDFRYFAQSSVISEDICQKIESSLLLFHQYKEAVMAAGARRGKKNPIENWFIPKLEFLQSVAMNTRYNGVACQWSADITENAHIRVVKDPARSGKNKGYESQICRYLDRIDKVKNFELATAIRKSGIEFGAPHSPSNSDDSDSDSDSDDLDKHSRSMDVSVTSTSELLFHIAAAGYRSGSRQETDYFYRAKILLQGLLTASSLTPARTYQNAKNVVYHLSRRANLGTLPIDEVAIKFIIPDLRPAISDFINCIRDNPDEESTYVTHIGGHRRARMDAQFSASHLEVWTKLRLQTTAYHYPHSILPASTIKAEPPSLEYPHGHFDPVVINTDQDQAWPSCGVSGKCFIIYPTRNPYQ